jgi:hypothetical protein
MQGTDGIIKFQKDRGLDKKEYNWLNESTNILEEILEAEHYDVAKEKREIMSAEFQIFIHMLQRKEIIVKQSEPENNDEKKDEIVDAYGDIIVFAMGAIMKLGYDPKLVLKEISKEINSRTGSIINGKFEKDLSDQAKEKWYKANFSTCKLSKK